MPKQDKTMNKTPVGYSGVSSFLGANVGKRGSSKIILDSGATDHMTGHRE
jgi:hypothetical protein